MSEKARYWWAVLYPENMISDWESAIGDVLQLPFAYCIHDKDIESDGSHRKTHVHLMVAFGNTTTEKNASAIIGQLSADGKQALADGGHAKKINNVRHAYNYLIHDTDTCRKQKKYAYSPKERITGNNFDIGAYEQISDADKKAMLREIISLSAKCHCMNLLDVYDVIQQLPSEQFSMYFDVFVQYQSLLTNLTKGAYVRSHVWDAKATVRKAHELRAREEKKAHEVEAREEKKAHEVEAREEKKAHEVEARELEKTYEVLRCDPETGEVIDD